MTSPKGQFFIGKEYMANITRIKAGDKKPEEKKNREKRRDNRRKFVAACQLFHEILEAALPVPTKEQKKEMEIEKLIQ